MIRKVGAAILSENGQRLLVVRKRGRDVFILPGGQPESGESLDQTLLRELREELGTGVTEMRHLMTVADVAAFENVPLQMEVFSVVLDGEPHPASEIVELAFVPADWRSSGLRLASGVTDHVLPRLFPEAASGGGSTAVPQCEPVAVMFSGGRDSTAVAVALHEARHPLHLISFRSGIGADEGLYSLRIAELDRLWPQGVFQVHELPTAGLVRELCFRDLVDDVLTDRRQMILLGEALAMVVRSVEFCAANGVAVLAMGATAYQSNYPEQQPGALRAFRELCEEFDVSFITPGVKWGSELEVKDRLRLTGLSTKSLESASLLADLDDHPPAGVVDAYLERKLPWAREYLQASVALMGRRRRGTWA
jgi:8-oxo-dGTP pyrophosphatase MutT (NUDIX family)